jgi:hypothetical protein
MGTPVYQKALQADITISGTGFAAGMEFVFEPPLTVGADYDIQIKSKNSVVLRLRAGKRWAAGPCMLMARAVKVDKKEYALAGSEGIRVAVILADPVVTASRDVYHESQSKLIVIEGSGFTNEDDVKITLRPTSPGAYKVLAVMDDAIRLQLKPDKDWLPSFMSLKDEDESKRITLEVASIDTGAGTVTFDDPVTVGKFA